MAVEKFDYTLRASDLFKNTFMKISENTYNSANVLLGRVKKSYDFTGSFREQAVPLGFAGGAGSGILPTANTENNDKAIIRRKKVYARVAVDRETIMASLSEEGAYVKAMKHVAEKGVETFMRNFSRILFGNGDGSLGTQSGVGGEITGVGTSVDPYTTIISAASWKEANWEERELVNVGAETTLLEVVAVDPDLRKISLVGTSAILAAKTTGAGGDSAGSSAVIYQQGSKDNDPQGLKGVCDATSSTLYDIPVQRRWKATQEAAGNASISPDLMNKVMLSVEKKCQKAPNMIMTSYKQYEKLLNILEDQKVYNLPARASELKGIISFQGIEFMSTRGPIGIFPERFCEDDRMYFLNDNFIEIMHAPKFGWFDDDGTVFLRTTSDDYEARYGGYLQVYIVPTFQGVITGLAV